MASVDVSGVYLKGSGRGRNAISCPYRRRIGELLVLRLKFLTDCFVAWHASEVYNNVQHQTSKGQDEDE